MWNDDNSTTQNQFDRLGHPGRIYAAHRYTSGQLDLTGSMYGYAAIKVVAHGGASASLSGGGSSITLDHFDDTSAIHPLSISQIHSGTAAEIYIFKVQGTI